MISGLEHLGMGLAEHIATHECMIDDRGDLMLTTNELENLSNAIWRRLMTPLGFYPEFPDYGSQLHELIGMGFVPETLSMAEIFVTQSLVKEPRIEKVVSIIVQPTDYRSILFHASVQPASVPSVYIMTFDYFLER